MLQFQRMRVVLDLIILNVWSHFVDLAIAVAAGEFWSGAVGESSEWRSTHWLRSEDLCWIEAC